MPHHRKLPYRSYKLQAPVHIWHDWKKNKWVLLDRMNTIIAENLSKELADTLAQAVNFCGVAIDFTKHFVDSEYLVRYKDDATDEEIVERNEMFSQALSFLIDLGIIEPPPTYIDGLPEWKKQLEDSLTSTISDSEVE